MLSDSTVPVSGFTISPAYVIILFILLLIVSGLFYAVAYAGGICGEKQLKKMADEDTGGADFAFRLLERDALVPEKARQISQLFFVISIAVFSIFLYNKNIAWVFIGYAVAALLGPVAAFQLPKRLAYKNPEKTVAVLIKPIYAVMWFLNPFCFLVTHVTNILLRLFGIDPKAGDGSVTEEEIRQMVEEGEETGAIPETEKVMINNVFEFNDITVSRIMTHRTDVVAIPHDSSYEEILEVVSEEGYTRIPVYEESLDNIKGILHIKSLLAYVKDVSSEFDINQFMIKPYFVPQAKLANELFSDMQKSKSHMAVVVDEYGGTAGIVTMEDLIEFILGNIQDEYDDEEAGTEVVDENTFYIDGAESMSTVCELADIELSEENEEDSGTDTVGGFIINLMDKIPEPGEKAIFENTVFEIIDADDKKINKVKVVKNENSTSKS